MRSIQEELQALRPLELDGGPQAYSADGPTPNAAVSEWEVVAQALGRMGKQQLRANQQTELIAEELRGALEQAKAAQVALRDQADDYRRKAQGLEADARESRLAALAILDALDDLATIARQKHDAQWTSRVERLTARTLEALADMGLSEVPALEGTFDERTHQVVDTVDRGTRDSYQVVEVLRRGFRFQGAVLRRAQVVTTR